MKTKSWAALILTLAMIFSLLPPQAFAEETETVTFSGIDGTAGNNGENYDNLFDGKKTDGNFTKWCVSNSAAHVIIKASSPVTVTGYTLTTGNDSYSYTGRNPKTWKLYGSNDYDEAKKTEGSWEEIHSVSDDKTMENKNFQPYSFTVDKKALYKYFKFDIITNQGGSCTQLCELEFTYEPCRHELMPTVEPATCTESGYTVICCYYCKEETSREIIPPLGHKSGETDGICANCGKSLPAKIGETYYEDIKSAVDAAAENSTVTLLNDDILESTLAISKNLTLDLAGFTLKQTGSGGVIKISSKKSFTLTDSSEKATGTLTGGNAYQGGGVYIGDGCGFKMTGGTITGCSASKDSDEANGHEAAYGGGVYVWPTGKFDMQGGIISNCTAECGGGIYVDGISEKENGKLNMSQGAVIKDCHAGKQKGGGGIYLCLSEATVTNITISGCTAGSGGGIHVAKGKLIADDCVIEDCTVGNARGGGIDFSDVTNATVKNSVIRNNHATNAFGGGISITGKADTVIDIDNCQIINNDTSSTGGGIYLKGGTLNITNGSEISGNTAKTDVSGFEANGGGIYASGGTLNINSGSSMRENRSIKGSGGAIFAANNTVLTAENCNLSENHAEYNGGGIYALNSKVNLNSGSYISSNASKWGAGVYIHASELAATEANVIGNTAAAFGGGYLIQNNGDTASKAEINGGEISGNTAKAAKDNGGGGIWIKGSSLEIIGCPITGNTATYGGGIQAAADDTTLNLKGGAVIVNNNATKTGGGIYNNSKNFMVSGDPQVYSNYAGEGNSAVSDNIYLKSGKKISGSLEEVDAPPRLGITLEDKSQDITGSFETDCSKYIHSDDANYYVVYDAGSKTHKLTESICITFDPQGGEFGIPKDYAPKGGIYQGPDGEPWRSGYRFLGWFKNGEIYDFSETVNEDFTLTAKWAKDGGAAIVLYSDRYVISGLSETEFPDVYLASYNEKGALIGTKRITATNGEMLIMKTGLETNGAAKIKAFIWNEKMLPVCGSAVKTLK